MWKHSPILVKTHGGIFSRAKFTQNWSGVFPSPTLETYIADSFTTLQVSSLSFRGAVIDSGVSE
jgi:hypothetical protein